MADFKWDATVDSDEEVEEFVADRNEIEEMSLVRFSKRGLIEYIENLLKDEAPTSSDPSVASAW